VLGRAPRPDPNAPLRPLHVLLVAGPKDHGPGEHDYPAWQRQWAALLAKAPGVRVSTAFPWPEADQWEGVDVAVFYLKTRWDAQQLADIYAYILSIPVDAPAVDDVPLLRAIRDEKLDALEQ